VWTSAVAGLSAINARDWDGVRRALDDDVTLVDHRSLGLPVLDREGVVDVLRAMADLSPDSRVRNTTVHRLTERGIAYEQHFGGTNAGGGEWEITGILVGGFRDDRCAAIEMFPLEDVEAALARFEELT